MDSTELDRVARDLKTACDDALYVFALCSGFVDVLAEEGDPRAVDLARLVAAAHDQLTDREHRRIDRRPRSRRGMTPALAARRLSGALGRKVAPDDIDFVHGNFVRLKAGGT
jgi:hypothetical protein